MQGKLYAQKEMYASKNVKKAEKYALKYGKKKNA